MRSAGWLVGEAIATLRATATRVLTVVDDGAATATLTDGAARLLTAIVAGAAIPMLTRCERILSGGVAITTVAEAKKDGSLVLVAVTVRVDGDGTVRGAV